MAVGSAQKKSSRLMYQLNNVNVTMGEKTLLHDLSLDFHCGEMCMIAGPNGAGKTTLLKVLDGEIEPVSGSVRFQDKALSSWDKNKIAQRRAVLPQSSSLAFPFTVHDVVALGRLPHKSTREINKQIIQEVMDLCDCAGLIHRPFPQLSGGEQQRVQIARVLSQIWSKTDSIPRFLLLDEPLSALDLSHQYSLLNALARLTSTMGTGIICVLHNLNLAAQFADRCLILDNGRLVADGAPRDVFTRETLSNVFDLEILIEPHPDNRNIPLIIPRITSE